MAGLENEFKRAQQKMNDLPQRPDNNTALRLYALYKQATEGDVHGERPGMMDIVRRAKFDAWDNLKGMTAEDAKRQYVDLAAQLTP